MPQSLLSLNNLSLHPTWFCIQSRRKLIDKDVRRGCAKNGVFGILFPGNSVSLLFELEKFTGASGVLFKTHGMFPWGSTMNPLPPDFQISKSKKRCNIHSSQFPEINLLKFCNNQGTLIKSFPAAALFLINASMLAMPFEALAETCEADKSLFNMPLLLSVALIGATVGGLLARKRRGELQRLNEQLRQINTALRRQAKIESYAPALSYAPMGGRIPESEVIVDPRKQELISRLKTGKNYLRNQDPEKAFEEFRAALELAQNLNDPTKEKKAARGLGASLQRQGKYQEAIQYHSMVLSISKRVGEDSGNTEAHGAIADCYAEIGDLEQAGRFYDKYIARLETD